MPDGNQLTSWWRTESERSFTKLECGLLGALFASIALILVLALRVAAG
jgi:hypothetical protein